MSGMALHATWTAFPPKWCPSSSRLAGCSGCLLCGSAAEDRPVDATLLRLSLMRSKRMLMVCAQEGTQVKLKGVVPLLQPANLLPSQPTFSPWGEMPQQKQLLIQ